MTIAERLIKIRSEQIVNGKKMSQEAFAKELGMERGRYKNYEGGTVIPDDAVIKLVCSIYHVRYDWLKTGEGEMYEENENLSPREVQMMLRGSFSNEQIAWAITMLQQPTEVLQGMTQMLRDYAEELNRIKRDRE